MAVVSTTCRADRWGMSSATRCVFAFEALAAASRATTLAGSILIRHAIEARIARCRPAPCRFATSAMSS